MNGRLPDFDADRDRSDPQRAEQLFDLLWPSRKDQIACARRLAQSIRCAHKQADASWVISMFDRYIRLNVGQVLVLQFKPGEVFFYACKTRGSSEFRAVRVPSRRFRYPSAEITSIPPQQWNDHERFINAAAEAKKISPFRRAFSEGIMLHLERLLQTELPRSFPDDATEENDRSESEFKPFDWPTAHEGRRQLAAHKKIERNPAIIKQKKNAVTKATGGLACEICTFDFRRYKGLGEGFCEVHHLRPLSEALSIVETSLDDLAVVCANCHRMIHRNGKALSLSDIQASLAS